MEDLDIDEVRRVQLVAGKSYDEFRIGLVTDDRLEECRRVDDGSPRPGTSPPCWARPRSKETIDA